MHYSKITPQHFDTTKIPQHVYTTKKVQATP